AGSDPARYAEAAAAFDRSLAVQADGNVAALAGQAALADARHQFVDGARAADRALAIDPLSPVALAALTDALTELGRYPQAAQAAQRLDDARPGVASFTRLSYQAELRGHPAQARDLLRRAATAADSPAEVAFCRAQEGLLALAVGDPAGAAAALAALAAGTVQAPADTTLLHLKARLAWATGDKAGARDAYARLVERRPTPAFATEQAELLAALGDSGGAAAALDVARAGYRLNTGSGVAVDPGQVLFEADHGSPAAAARLGAQLWAAAPSVSSADAYAWALHSARPSAVHPQAVHPPAAGQEATALQLADRALWLGGRTATTLYHRAEIRATLGQRAGAVADLRAALTLEPRFSPLHSPRAQALLTSLTPQTSPGGAR
ncbi:MAG TPA: hypothetical protein VHN80_29500, partial [Kineosporiaceae bacterium]|nr:hypothetical protein [Kineosporiaceae bacterium]